MELVEEASKCLLVHICTYACFFFFLQVFFTLLSIWSTLTRVCGRKKVEPECEGVGSECEGEELDECKVKSPDSVSPSSSFSDHMAIEMEPTVSKPVTPVTPATPATPVSGSKRVQTPVTPIRGAGPEPNPSLISSKQTQVEEQKSELDSEDAV